VSLRAFQVLGVQHARAAESVTNINGQRRAVWAAQPFEIHVSKII